jgi:hypothetical protein
MTLYHVVQPQVDCKTAAEFLEALSPLGPHFKSTTLNNLYIFRGQGEDKPLIPSMYRKGNLAAFTRLEVGSFGNKRLAERDILIQFFEIADKRGLALPDDSQKLRRTLEILRSERGDHITPLPGNDDEWRPTNQALSLAALAQHYGLPTPLLDWSRRSFIAAFFAAESASRKKGYKTSKRRMVVWSLYFRDMGKQEISENTPIRLITAPSVSNENLKAQQGLFTLMNSHHSGEISKEYAPMEDVAVHEVA